MRTRVISTLVLAVVLLTCTIWALPQAALADTYNWVGLGSAAVTSTCCSGSRLYVGYADGHVYSYDGTTWDDTGILADATVESLVCSDTNVYAACGNGQIFRLEGGLTWTDLGYLSGVRTLAWTGTDLYAGSGSGHVYRYDGGSWIDSWPDGEGSVVTLAWDGTYLYAGGGFQHIYRYDGVAWSDIRGTPDNETASCLLWTGTDLYVAVNDGHILRYDGGVSWIDVGNIGPYAKLAWDGTHVWASSEDGRMFRYDGGSTWVDAGFTSGSSANALSSNGVVLYAGSDNGHVYVHDTVGWNDTWPTRTSGVNSFALNGGSLYAGCANGHVYRQEGGGVWTDLLSADISSVNALAGDGTSLYAGCRNGHVYRFDGEGWSDTGSIPASTVLALAWDGAILYSACDNGHVYRLDGSTWIDTGLPGGSPVNSLQWNGSNLYAGCDNGHVYRCEGPAWTDVRPSGNSAVKSLAWDGASLFAGCSSGYVYSYNGSTWTTRGAVDASPSPVVGLAFSGSCLYAANSRGFVCRYKGGTQWTRTSSGGVSLRALESMGTELFAGGSGGVWAAEFGLNVTSIDPFTGVPGATLTGVHISGEDFRGPADNVTAQLKRGMETIDCDVREVTPLQLTVDFAIPASVAVGAWDVYVRHNDDQTDVTLAEGFRVQGLPPQVTGIDPGQGDSGQVLSGVQINGNCFRGPSSNVTVQLRHGAETINGSVTSVADTRLTSTFTIPTWATPGAWDVCLKHNDDLQQSTLSAAFHVLASGPHVTGINPDEGDLDQTLSGVQINGTDFRGPPSNVTVQLKRGEESIPCTVTDVVATRVLVDFHIPTGATPGAWDVCLKHNDDLQQSTLSGAFHVCQELPPVVVSINPPDGCPGKAMSGVRIAGSQFRGPVSNIFACLRNGTESINCNVTSVSQTCITADVIVPADTALGLWDVYIEHRDDGQSSTLEGAFDVQNWSPAIYGISPDCADQGQFLTGVKIDGAHFRGPPSNVTVQLKRGSMTINGTVNEVSTSMLTAEFRVPGGAALGEWDVFVKHNDDSKNTTLASSFTIALAKPVIYEITPGAGQVGQRVTLTGAHFGTTRGRSTVSLAGTSADVVSWSDTRIVITVPKGASSGTVVVTTAGGTSNTDRSFTVEQSRTWYLAEGSNLWGFSTCITIQNPNDSKVTARVMYMPAAAGPVSETVVLPSCSQTTLTSDHLIAVMGGPTDFSTSVESTSPIAVDRTLRWSGGSGEQVVEEGHSSIGVSSPSTIWYLPEGSSNWGFETWTLVQNPNAVVAHCVLTYMSESGEATAVSHQVPANSRASISMSEDIGQKDASIKVSSDQRVIAERAMYRNNRREGHGSIGTTSASMDYYLAEGCTGYSVGYVTYVLIQNPNNSAADVSLTYMTGSGQVTGPSFRMPANSRKSIRLNDQVRSGVDVSTHVHGSAPIIAERAMYWNNGTGEACHDSIGTSSPRESFFLPDGQSSGGYETWILVQNANTVPVKVEVSYLTPDGRGNVTRTETIAANTRRTFDLAEHSGISGRAAIAVSSRTSGKKIIVERAMYWNNRGAGTDTIGGAPD